MHSGKYDDFELILWKEIGRCIDEGYDTFYCGGARGADIVCGEIIIAEKMTKSPHIQLVCAIPYKEQADRWGWMWRTARTNTVARSGAATTSMAERQNAQRRM